MPIPIQAKKKFTEAKAKAAIARDTPAQVGMSKEELEEKYKKINAENAAKLKEKEVQQAQEALEDTEEQEVPETEEIKQETSEEETQENNEEGEETWEANAEQEAESETEEDRQEDLPPRKEEKSNEQIAQERVVERGNVEQSDIAIATIPKRETEIKPKQEDEPFIFKPQLINLNPNNDLQGVKDLMNFNLDSVTIEMADNDLKMALNEDTVFSEDSVYQVVLLKSGYVAHMSAITFRDRDAIRGSLAGRTSNKDIVNFRRKLYQLVHSKIRWTSVGNLTFEEFLKITAYDDLETLFFGIFCKSNPKDSSYTIKCPYCGFVNKVMVNPQTLASIHDPSAFKYIDDILKNKALTPFELVKQSMVSSKQRILLPNSKIIAEIKVPSLGDYLNFSVNYSNTNLRGDDLTETIGFLVYLDRLLVPNIEKIKATGKPFYIEERDFFKMLSLISRMDLGDGETLVDAINEREAKYKLGYEIKPIKCSGCAKELESTSVSMEDFCFGV